MNDFVLHFNAITRLLELLCKKHYCLGFHGEKARTLRSHWNKNY